MKRALQTRVPAAIAALTVLALLIAPLCSALCAAPGHCPAEAVTSQAESDVCHRLLASSDTTEVNALAAPGSCAPQETSAITSEEPSSQFRVTDSHHSTPTNLLSHENASAYANFTRLFNIGRQSPTDLTLT